MKENILVYSAALLKFFYLYTFNSLFYFLAGGRSDALACFFFY